VKHLIFNISGSRLVPSHLKVPVISLSCLPHFEFSAHFLHVEGCQSSVSIEALWKPGTEKQTPQIPLSSPSRLGVEKASLLPKRLTVCALVQLVLYKQNINYCFFSACSVLIYSHSIFFSSGDELVLNGHVQSEHDWYLQLHSCCAINTSSRRTHVCNTCLTFMWQHVLLTDDNCPGTSEIWDTLDQSVASVTEKFAAVVHIHVCLIWPDSVLTLQFILLHHQC